MTEFKLPSRRILRSLGFILILSFILARPVSAGIKEKLADWTYTASLYSGAQVVNDTSQKVFSSLQETIYQPTDLSKFFQVQQYIKYAQILAGVWLTFVIVLKGSSGAFLDRIYGETTIGELMQRAVAGYALIFLMPWAIEHIWIYFSNLLVQGIFSLPLNNDPLKTLQCFMTPYGSTPDAMTLILKFGAMCFSGYLAVTSTIRYAEILGFYMFSPVIATTIAYKGDLLTVFAKELTAVVFSQVWQATCIYLIMGLLTCSQGVSSNLLLYGVLWVAAKGPAFLKGWAYYSSGVGKSVMGGFSQTTRMAVYSTIRKVA